jgi:uncharacterized protein YndB with AHSA1/START domain
MGFPDRIERTVEIAHPPATVWGALATRRRSTCDLGDRGA